MKKILLVLVIITTCFACGPSEYAIRTYYLDYSFFKERDFFITETNTVSFPYESLGSISVEIESGAVYKPIDRKGKRGYNRPRAQRKYILKDATIEDTYQLVYNLAREKGANGILRFEIKPLFKEKTDVVRGYVITGMAIKK